MILISSLKKQEFLFEYIDHILNIGKRTNSNIKRNYNKSKIENKVLSKEFKFSVT